MAADTQESETTTFMFPGGWKRDIEERLDSFKTLAESPAVKKFTTENETGYEVIVTVTERKKA